MTTFIDGGGDPQEVVIRTDKLRLAPSPAHWVECCTVRRVTTDPLAEAMDCVESHAKAGSVHVRATVLNASTDGGDPLGIAYSSPEAEAIANALTVRPVVPPAAEPAQLAEATVLPFPEPSQAGSGNGGDDDAQPVAQADDAQPADAQDDSPGDKKLDPNVTYLTLPPEVMDRLGEIMEGMMRASYQSSHDVAVGKLIGSSKVLQSLINDVTEQCQNDPEHGEWFQRTSALGAVATACSIVVANWLVFCHEAADQ